jgi:hypothetical protein
LIYFTRLIVLVDSLQIAQIASQTPSFLMID